MPVQYRVPASVDEMRPPKASSVITEMALFQRAHLEDLRPWLESMSGERPSIHGSFPLDEAACVFEIKRLCAENGYALLGTVPTVDLRRAFRFGYKRNTGVSMRLIQKQYRTLQLEYRAQQPTP